MAYVATVSLDYLKLNQKVNTTFYCCAVVLNSKNCSRQFTLSNFSKRHGMFENCCTLEENDNSIEFGSEAKEKENIYNYDDSNIVNPVIPCILDVPDGLYLGMAIDVKGKVHNYCQRFSINLSADQGKDSDVFFHLNPRFDRRVVVRNTKRKGRWEEEEIACVNPFPFITGRGFSLTLFIADGKIMVAVNHRHFCSFTWRMTLELGKVLKIEGDTSISLIQFKNCTDYPVLPKSKLPKVVLPTQRMDTLVTVKRKAKAIEPGTVVVINGRVKLLPQSFYVNLQVGSCIVPHPVIPLHINLRLCQPGHNEQQIIYNSWVNGSWGSEIKPKDCPFLPGMVFSLQILYLEDGFHISVNGKFLIAFPLRLPYPPILDTLYVEGDVIVTEVKFLKKTYKSVKDN